MPAMEAVDTITPRSPSSSGSSFAILSGRQPHHVESADQVNPNHAGEVFARGIGAVSADDSLLQARYQHN